MQKFEWGKIESDKTFQRLITHLFALECNSPGFIPCSPYNGADDGWDGKYVGDFEGLTGTFCIQAKYTKKDFKAAVTFLKQEIRGNKQKKGEFEKAIVNKVDNFILVTQA